MTPQWSRGQWALRTTMAGGILLALASTALLGVTPRLWLVALVAVLALSFARWPESHTGAVAMAVVLVWWGVSLRDGLHPEALVAAAGLLASHLAGVVAEYGPDELPVDPSTLRRWAGRGAAIFLPAPAVWLVAVWLRGRPEPSGIWVAGLVAALLATVGATSAFARTRRE